MIHLFDNTEYAFQYKTDRALRHARLLFSVMGSPWLVSAGTRITPWALKNGLPVKGIIRNTLFKQFVGGESMEATKSTAALLDKYHVGVILDYALEGGNGGDAAHDSAAAEFIKAINYASTVANIPFISVKITGLGSFVLLEKLDTVMQKMPGGLLQQYHSAIKNLSQAEALAWDKIMARITQICQAASEKNIGVLIDAEESWIQAPVDAISTIMMMQYNTQAAIVYNTAQLYRHDRLAFLKESHRHATANNYILAMKVVRGAYMEKERKRALELGYASPIQPDKAATDRDYNEVVMYCIDNCANISTIIATHNEQSNLLALQQMDDKKIAHNHAHIHFSQLFGMSDNITFNLARQNCNVSKYLPFGPIEDVIPYLMRRAQENTSVKGQTGRELNLIKTELQRRKKLRT